MVISKRIYFAILILSFILTTYTHAQVKNKIIEIQSIKHITNSNVGEWQNKKVMSCSLVAVIGLDQKDPNGFLKGPKMPFVDRESFVYVPDYASDMVKIYDSTGKLSKIISNSSINNDIFKKPRSIFVDSSKNIYCLSDNIHIFSSYGKFIKTLESPININSLFYNSTRNQMFAISSSYDKTTKDFYQKGLIIPFSFQGFKFAAFGRPPIANPSINFWTENSVQAQCLPDGKIILAIRYPHEIRIYLPDGNLQTVITRNDTIFMETYEYRNLLLTRRRFGTILVFPDGKFMLGFLDRGHDWIEKAKKGNITSYDGIVYDIYNSKGVFLQSFNQPQNLYGILRFVDIWGNGYEISIPHYGMKAGNFIINKYKIEFKDKS